MFKKKRRKVKPFGLILAIIMALQMMGTTAFAYYSNGKSYDSNWYYWSQGDTGEYQMGSGCRIVAQAKLLAEAGVVSTADFDPDVYYTWLCSKGQKYIKAPNVSEMTSITTGDGMIAYAAEKGYTINRIVTGGTDVRTSTIMNYINNGYYVILNAPNHQTYVSRQTTLYNGTPWISESSHNLSTVTNRQDYWYGQNVNSVYTYGLYQMGTGGHGYEANFNSVYVYEVKKNMPVTPPTPPAPPDITMDYINGYVNTTSDMEYSLNGGDTWISCNGPLYVGDWYDFDNFMNIRYKANGNTPAGYQLVININRYSKPKTAIDYFNETISTTSKMAFSTAGGSGDCYDNMSLSSLYWNGSEMTAYIWVKPNTAFRSDNQVVYIPARPDAPVGVGKVDGTSENSGKLIGVSDTMQYKAENGSWIDCDGNEVTGLAAGTYYIRYKATNSSFASEAVTLTIENKTVSGESNIEITVPSFSSVEEGYERPEAKAITISNTGDADAEITSVEVDNTEAFEISGSGTTVGSNDSIDTYTIQPKEGLSAGIYNGTITVKYDNNKTATYDISFVVTEKAVVGESKLNVIAPSFSSVEEGYERPEAKAITISNTGDADAEITNVEVDNTKAFEISGNGTTVGSNDSIDTYAIQPKEGLSAGIYNGTVTVEYDNGKTATAEFTFTVTEKGIVIETQTPPSAPKLESRTKTSITLKKIKDNKNGAKAEYRIDGGKWQSSNVFKGLEPDTKYVFEARYAAVDNFEASEPSESAKISTAKKSSGGSGPSYTLDKVENSNSNTNKNDKPETKPEETKKSIFADVSLDNPNYDAIVKAYEKGYMVGTSENTFAPDGFLTRGMAAQIIWNIAGNPEPSDVSPFLDVTSDMYYAKAVAWAYERGIVLGYDITKFGPDDFVTIEQFDIMMAKYNSEAAAPYTGVSPNATRGYVASRIAL